MPITVTALAPGRCGIVGNPSDIYGGVVVSCSIPARATCRLTLGGEAGLPEDLTLWEAAVVRFPLDGPVKVEWNSAIPRSSGLAGSSALLAATLACVAAALGQSEVLEDRIGFAELVRDAERHGAGVVGGFQDAYMVVHGGLNRLDFAGKNPLFDTEAEAWKDGTRGPRGSVQALQSPLPFLLVTTGVERLSGSVHGPIAARWMRGEKQVVDAMARIADLGREGADALVGGNWNVLAAAMTENHALMADLGGSGDAIDHLIERCLARGALAAKLAGAGMGGTVIALTEDAEGLQRGLVEDGYSRFMVPAVTDGLSVERF